MIESYKIESNIVKFYIPRKRGKYKGIYECLIDLEDFNKIKDKAWNVCYRESMQGFYIIHTEYIGTIEGKAKYKSILLHKFLMKANNNTYVDHINHNGLDNRKENLRVTANEENTKNRKGANRNNTSGYRNVSKVGNWWYVQIMVNSKNTLLKKFPLDQLEEAAKYAKEMREKYYKEFAGAS